MLPTYPPRVPPDSFWPRVWRGEVHWAFTRYQAHVERRCARNGSAATGLTVEEVFRSAYACVRKLRFREGASRIDPARDRARCGGRADCRFRIVAAVLLGCIRI